MNNLHRDTLKEIAPVEFEEAVFRAAMTAARRTRRKCVVMQIAGAACAVGLGTMLLLRSSAPVQVAVSPSSTQVLPLPEEHRSVSIVQTRPLPPEQLLITGKSLVTIVRSASSDANHFHVISDDQLLSFFEGRSVALISRGPHDAELIFPDQIAPN